VGLVFWQAPKAAILEKLFALRCAASVCVMSGA
jgi:hypothetical protein